MMQLFHDAPAGEPILTPSDELSERALRPAALFLYVLCGFGAFENVNTSLPDGKPVKTSIKVTLELSCTTALNPQDKRKVYYYV